MSGAVRTKKSVSSVCIHSRCKFGPHNLLKQGASASVHQCIVAAIIQIVPAFPVVMAFREFGLRSFQLSDRLIFLVVLVTAIKRNKKREAHRTVRHAFPIVKGITY